VTDPLSKCECCGDPGDLTTRERPCGCLLCDSCMDGMGSTCKHGPHCSGRLPGERDDGEY
jgi:hypothetical protein